ncbi:MAG: hypothetical protein ACSHXA_02430 [Polaribacter sp.]|uniref:hypothetical protein n=1 Tax=Polaribacter sp. TaxID=1920175 RepID=UPI003EF55880
MSKSKKTTHDFHTEQTAKWIVNNLESAKILTPEIIGGLEKRIITAPPFTTANIIEKIPNNFVNWKNEIENTSKTGREKKIQQYLELVELILYKKEFDSEIINISIDKIKPELIEMEVFLKKLLLNSTNPKKISTYEWLSSYIDKELTELHLLMVEKYKLISPETTYNQFKVIFTNQIIVNDFKPIKWHDDNASELLYFIKRLEESNNIEHTPKRADYKKMTTCFTKPNGETFKASWKQIKQNININLSIKKQKAIDELISNF